MTFLLPPAIIKGLTSWLQCLCANILVHLNILMINHSNDKIVQLIFNYNKISKIFTRTIFVMMKIFKGSVNSHIFFLVETMSLTILLIFHDFLKTIIFKKFRCCYFFQSKLKKLQIFLLHFFRISYPETFLKPCQASMMEIFAKIVKKQSDERFLRKAPL